MARQFAFGANHIAGCDCPARQAGFDPREDPTVRRVAERYDEKVREAINDEKVREAINEGEGLISRKQAKSFWDLAVKELEREKDNTAAEMGETILEEVF